MEYTRKNCAGINEVEFHALCKLKSEITTLNDQYIEHGYVACLMSADPKPYCNCCTLKQDSN